MSRNPQLNASNYIVNIVPIQNTITNISGLNPLDVLANKVTNIQEMVDYPNKRINVNTIAAFNTTPISMIDSLNLCNAGLYSNGVLFGGGTSNTLNIFNGAAAFVGSTGLLFTSTNIQFSAQGSNSLTIDSNTSFYTPVFISSALTINQNPIQGTSLQCLDTIGTTAWGYVSTLATADVITLSGLTGEIARFTTKGLGIGVVSPTETLDVKGTASFSGRVSAFDFLTLSDRRFKTNITDIENAGDLLNKIRGVRFMWRDLSSNDIGVIAQELQEVLPEAVMGLEEVNPKLSVAYHKIIPVLVEVVKDLQKRIVDLELTIKDIQEDRVLQ